MVFEKIKSSRRIQARLIGEMRRGGFAGEDRLPKEQELAELLGISRTQLRDVLAKLELDGYITRRQGVGTLINRQVVDIPVRMDTEIEFLDMVRESGMTPTERVDTIAQAQDADAAAKLGVSPDTPLLLVARTVLADGTPAIYCEDLIPMQSIRRAYADADFSPPIFEFLEEYCNALPCMDVTEVRAVAVSGAAGKALNLADGTPVLYMDEVDYDRDGKRVLYSRQYYADGVIRHSIVRRKV